MSDEEYRPRPNDDLVEPLFGGIQGADGAEAPPRGTLDPRRVLVGVVLVGLVAWWALSG